MTESHWEKIFKEKPSHEMSWTQKVPTISLAFIKECRLSKDSGIIDVGGGDSNLVDFLLMDNYTDITVLDISETALLKAKSRLGNVERNVDWIVSDILKYSPCRKFCLWHDRAFFHFFTEKEDIASYVKIVNSCVLDYLLLSTFSEEGPTKCSNLPVIRYSAEHLSKVFSENFELIKSAKHIHLTPFETKQNFIYSLFKRKKRI